MAHYHLLSTDASRNASGDVYIGAVLRQRASAGLVVIDYVSKAIEPVGIYAAEYEALIQGLELARAHKAEELRVFCDQDAVVKQVNNRPKKLTSTSRPYFERATLLIDEYEKGKIQISWLPRELNSEAHQRAADASINQWAGSTTP